MLRTAHLICYASCDAVILTLWGQHRGVLVYSLDREVFRRSAQTNQSVRIPLRFFHSIGEALLLPMPASRIFPTMKRALAPGSRALRLYRPPVSWNPGGETGIATLRAV